MVSGVKPESHKSDPNLIENKNENNLKKLSSTSSISKDTFSPSKNKVKSEVVSLKLTRYMYNLPFEKM